MFVAGFVGSPAMNLIDVQVAQTSGAAVLRSPDGWSCALSPANARKALSASSPDLVLGARHSSILLHGRPRPGAVPARVYTLEPTGDVTYAHVDLGSTVAIVSVAPTMHLQPDQEVWLELDQQRLHLFDARTRLALRAS